ncbi:WAP four-disulfide core domain protein 13 [Ctenodactylus gundi]
MTPVLRLQFLLVVFSLAPQLVPGAFKKYFVKDILDPPPCNSEPENCTHLCTLDDKCPPGFHCCSSFCGIVCSINLAPNRKM